MANMVFCDYRFLLVVAAVAFIYIQMRLFATQTEYADRLAAAVEEENHCTTQMRLLIDQISMQQGRIVALEEERKRREQECAQLKGLVEELERKGLQRLTDKVQVPVAAVVIMACNRADYLERTINSVLKYQSSVALKYPVFVSQDGSHPDVKRKALSYDQLTYMQHLDSEPPKTERPGEMVAYYKIARHYKWALDELFYKHNLSRVIILEDDMEIAPDFFDYFEAAAALLDKDKSIMAVSSWNDNGQKQFKTAFEIGVVVPKRNVEEENEDCNCLEVLVDEFTKVGLIVEKVQGVADEFIKLAAPLETLGRAAAELKLKKRTRIGMDLQFEWEEVDAFVKQPDGSLFSWFERFHCYNHLIYGIVNKSKSAVTLKYDGKEFCWEVGENLVPKLESVHFIKQVFPLHDEMKRKKLLKNWALNWWDITDQPIDEIYSYFGAKIAIYFAFLGMYTRWMFFPAAFAITVQLIDFGSLQLLVLPIFFIGIILWAVMFSQFWKRKNSALLDRWQISYSVGVEPGCKLLGMEWGSLQSPVKALRKWGTDKTNEKEVYQRSEWFGHLLRFRNDAIVIMSIIFLQLPFELAYAHLYEVIVSDVMKFGLTAVYLFAIQHFTRIGGKISVSLIKYENNETAEKRADSLVYKVFGLYFMQTYIGVFYHALLHRNFLTLRKVLIQRLLISEVLENLLENSLPYLKYSYKKYRVRKKKRCEKGSATGKIQFSSRVEKEYLKPSYTASIGEGLEDGLFDDCLELALQFGMIMMFACAFPLAFAFATLNNITEIRTDALKLLAMLKRPVPRAATTIGAWLNIFQFLIVMSICTNCAFLVWFYDHEGKWSIEPGLAIILVIEHILLLIKFGFSRFVPEEPAWVRANRVKNATQAQDVCSKQLLRTISGGRKMFGEVKESEKNDL